MKSNAEKKINAEQFFSEARIHADEKKVLESDFSNNLREKLQSLYLLLNADKPLSFMSKLKFLYATKKALVVAGGLLVFLIIATVVTTLAIPSLRNEVANTAANLFGKDGGENKEDTDKPDSEETPSDTTAPELTITSPADGSTNVDSVTTITGKTEPGVKVYVGDAEVDNVEGTFSKQVELKVGGNTFTVKAVDAAGNGTTKAVTITRVESSNTDGSTPDAAAKITLSGAKVDGGIKLTWTVANMTAPNGFKVLKGSTATLTIANAYKYIENGATRSVILPIANGQTYYFRICQYLDGGTCGTYSNSVKVTAPGSEGTIGTFTGPVQGDGRNVSWTYSGSGHSGFKVVWMAGADGQPVYPGNYAIFYGADATSGSFGEEGMPSGTYRVRVCAYYSSYPDNPCKAYSNTITVNL